MINMNSRILLFSCVLLSLLTASSCGNNTKPDAKEETENSEDTSSISGPLYDTVMDETVADSSGIKGVANKNKVPDAPPPNYSSLPGPVGFVSDENLIMREKPSAKSNKIATLKMNETIYIIETSMIGDDDKQTEYPTWYSIERKNKERGWVKASSISSGH